MGEKTIPKTPTGVAEFNKVWLKYVLDQWLNKQKSNEHKTVEITSFTANKNGLQVWDQFILAKWTFW